MDNLVKKREETTILEIKVTSNLLLFWLKSNIKLTNKKVEGNFPNTILGIIPFGKDNLVQPLRNISAVKSSNKFYLSRLITGILLICFGLISMLINFGLIDLIILLIGITGLLNCYTAGISISNHAGGGIFQEVSILEKDKINTFVNKVNEIIIDLD